MKTKMTTGVQFCSYKLHVSAISIVRDKSHQSAEDQETLFYYLFIILRYVKEHTHKCELCISL